MTASPRRQESAAAHAWIAELFEPVPIAVGVLAGPLDGALAELSAEERGLVDRAVPKRQAEFATGRRMSRQLLAELGFPIPSLLRDADRVPLWPEGAVGSISHAKGLCVVAVARAEQAAAIGVDVEPDVPLEPAIWPRIATPDELRFIEAQPEAEQGILAHAVFSVKECVYKAAFPARRERWGFQEVDVTLLPEREAFRAETPAAAGGREQVEGRLLRRDGYFVAGVLHAR